MSLGLGLNLLHLLAEVLQCKEMLGILRHHVALLGNLAGQEHPANLGGDDRAVRQAGRLG
jgi:hypothetical protein